MRIKSSGKRIDYVLWRDKSDVVLGVIGGVVIFWYILIGCLGRAYNKFNVRARLAWLIYD